MEHPYGEDDWAKEAMRRKRKTEDERNMDKCLEEWDDLVNTDQDILDYL